MKDDFKEAAVEGDRGVQERDPPPQPGRRRRQAHRRGPAARGDEHRRQEGQARRARPLRRQRLDAHRGLGRQHGHPHPRHPRVRQPAPVRAGRRSRPAPPRATRVNDEGRFEPEYAEVYGVPFAFIPTDRVPTRSRPRSARRSRCERCPSGPTCASRSRSSTATGSSCPTEPLFGRLRRGLEAPRRQDDLRDLDRRSRAWSASATSIDLERRPRRPPAASRVRARAQVLVDRLTSRHDGEPVHTRLSRSSSRSPSEWLDECVTFEPDCDPSDAAARRVAAPGRRAAVRRASSQPGGRPRRDRSCRCFDRFDPDGSTDDVSFFTRKVVVRHRRSHRSTASPSTASRATPGRRRSPARSRARRASAVVREERPPRASRSRTSTPACSHDYVPDFLVRLAPDDADDERPHAHHRGVGRPQGPGRRARRRPTPPRPVVPGGEQPRRLRPLGLRRDRRHDPRRIEAATQRSTGCHADPLTRRWPTDRNERQDDMAPRKKKPQRHRPRSRRPSTSDKRTNIPTADAQDFVAARGRAADDAALPAGPVARPAARVEGQGRAGRRRPRGRRAADLHPGEDRPAGAGREPAQDRRRPARTSRS